MRERLWTVLLVLNVIVPAIGGVVLFLYPSFVPSSVNIVIGPDQYLLSYLIGAAEFAFAYICLFALKNKSIEVRRLVAVTAIIFHGAAGAATLLAWLGGTSPLVLINTIARAVMVMLFVVVGLNHSRSERT